MESRMKSLAGALMDCMVMPIQNKIEEWKKITNVIDKEHAKEYKKHRVRIKKRSDQVGRLRKKLRKDHRSVPDPSVQRLLDSSSKELSSNLKSLEQVEKSFLKRVLNEEKLRYSMFANCVKPVIDEELRMFGELAQVEDIMAKLAKVSSNQNNQHEDQIIEDMRCQSRTGEVTSSPSHFASPPSTPSSNTSSLMGSRKNSMSSLSSITSSSRASSVIAGSSFEAASPSHSSNTMPSDNLSLSGSVRLSVVTAGDTNSLSQFDSISNFEREGCLTASSSAGANNANTVRPSSAGGSSFKGTNLQRPHTISSSFERNGIAKRPQLNPSTLFTNNNTTVNLNAESSKEVLTYRDDNNGIQSNEGKIGKINSEPTSPSKTIFEQGFSTIKRVYSNRNSPFRRSISSQEPVNPPQAGQLLSKRPPLPQRCVSADRSNGLGQRPASAERPPSAMSTLSNLASPGHYAVPRKGTKIQLVPDFHQGKNDMVLPQPVYMNSQELKGLQSNTTNMDLLNSPTNDDDLKTPTVEEIAFPGQKATGIVEDGSSTSSSGSVGSSSGYGSQSAILPNSNLQQDYQNRNLAGEGLTNRNLSRNSNFLWTNSILNNNNLIRNNYIAPRRSIQQYMKRSDSYTPGLSNNLQRSLSHASSYSAKPPPPVRRTPSLKQSPENLLYNGKNCELLRIVDDDETPHGSVENLQQETNLQEMAEKACNVAESLQNSVNFLRRSTSMSSGPSSLPVANFSRDPTTRRSLNMANSPRPVTFGNSTLQQPPQNYGNPDTYNKVSTHHVISVRGDKPSPDGEIYGFGKKFRENSRQYFNPATSSSSSHHLMTKEALQNQRFLDSLSAKLTGQTISADNSFPLSTHTENLPTSILKNAAGSNNNAYGEKL